MTTAHRVDDVRIVEKECRALAGVEGYRITIVGEGEPPSDFPLRHISIAAPPPRRLVRLSTACPRAWRAIRKIRADVWHFHDPELLPVAIWLARRGERVVWDAHEDYLEQIDSAAGKEWIPPIFRGSVRTTFATLLRTMDHRAAAVVAATDHIAGSYRNKRTVVVGNEARPEEFASCEPKFGSRNLLFIGHAGPMTCFPEVVRAVQELPDFTLTVAGPAPAPAIAAEASARLGSRFVELGMLDRNSLKSAFSNSCVGFVTYADRPTYATNCPNKIFEFAAAGLPSIGTPNPSFKSRATVGGFGVVAEDFSAEGIRTAISLATSDYPAWSAMASRGRDWAHKEGSWNSSRNALIGAYASILSA